jgi:hypothetical protein
MILTFTATSGRAIAFAWFKAGIAGALVAKKPIANAKSVALINAVPPPVAFVATMTAIFRTMTALPDGVRLRRLT